MPPIPKSGKKTRNKHRHIANERISEYEPCNLCRLYPASQTHEVFHNGSAYMRNTSINYKAQLKLCPNCHSSLHNNPRLEDNIKANHQSRIMHDYNLSTLQFIEVFGKNYL